MGAEDELRRLFSKTPLGNLKVGDIEFIYNKKLKGLLPNVADRIESECEASQVLFEDFNDFIQLMKCRDGDYVYLTIIAVKTESQREPWAFIKIDKILAEKEK